jgi:murein DD-endopeptidase MepM/ murein hydrolase activator NlpD
MNKLGRTAAALALAALLVVGCSPRPATKSAPAVSLPEASLTPTAQVAASTQTPAVEAIVSPSPAFTSTAALTPTPLAEVCSPLEGIAIGELVSPDLLKNPFQPPRPGMDDGHHGVDFAYWSRGERKEMLGHPIQAALAGRVAGIILNRQPYGNAVIIETPLTDLPAQWRAGLPEPQPTLAPLGNLRCPEDTGLAFPGVERSLYLLYAHMNKAPLVEPGQKIGCGQVIGEVGTTGKSVNPHLHLEARAGPAGASLSALAHYDTAATDLEMAAYCAWRTSGLFQMVDPMGLFTTPALQDR